jgi:hypothetical protein
MSITFLKKTCKNKINSLLLWSLASFEVNKSLFRKDYRPAILLSILILLSACSNPSNVKLEGALKKWHRVSLYFEGPQTSELAADNPFLNYRLNVIFSNGDKTYTVPGYYAADGKAAESSASSGNVWITHFTPDVEGTWNYEVSFQKGPAFAVADAKDEGITAGFMDGLSGSFVIGPNDKTGRDNRAKGRLQYVKKSYLQYQESKDYFIKLGVDAPENLLAYSDFDNTTNALGFLKEWAPHANDFKEEAQPYVWQNNKGKNLLGAIHYLASEELNVFSFLTFNVDGDDRNVFPHLLKVTHQEYEEYASNKKNVGAWGTLFYNTRFDVSKLDQWERIFQYAETLGMFLHFKTHETETDHLMDDGVFGTEGKLYYRELIARFGHHLALNWNLGEENNQPTLEVLKAAAYVHDLDPYKHHMVLHTYPNQDQRYEDFIGDQSPLTGASLQLRNPEFTDVHARVLKWRDKSNATGKKWALSVDEPGSAKIALLPDDEDRDHDLARINAMWGTLLAGGYGVEWYFGYASPNSDLTCQDFRSRDLFWDQNRYALNFFKKIPFWEMEPSDHLTTDDQTFCFSKIDEIYVVYIPMELKTTSLNLGNSGKKFDVQWYNPRTGGELQKGSIPSVDAMGIVNIGFPPGGSHKDWVVLLKEI